MLIEDIVEDEGALWTEGVISWLSINIGSYQGKRLQIVNGNFHPCVGIFPGSVYRWGEVFERLLAFSSFFMKQNSKTKNRTACRHTFLSRLTTRIANYTKGLHNFI